MDINLLYTRKSIFLNKVWKKRQWGSISLPKETESKLNLGKEELESDEGSHKPNVCLLWMKTLQNL